MRDRLPPRAGVAAAVAVAAALWIVAAILLWQTRVPGDLVLPAPDPRASFDAAELGRAAAFERGLRAVALLGLAAEVVALVLFALRAPRFARGLGLGPVGSGIIVGVVMMVLLWAVSLPFGLAQVWWQRRYGLWREGYLEWIVTPWAELFALAVGALATIALAMALARRFRRHWWLAGAPVFTGVALVLTFLFPYLELGLERVPDAEIRRDLPALREATGAGPTPVRVAVMSDVTSAPNALTAGLGPSEQVILWDTFFDGRFTTEEVRVVVAHELAHAGREHLWKGVAWFLLFAFPLAFGVAELTRMRGGLAYPENVPLAALALTLLSLLAAPATNAVTRHYEEEADWVALEATRDPDGARALFESFTEEALEHPTQPAWSQALFGTHPPVMERIAMAEAWRARNG